MKTKIITLTALVVVFTITIASTKTGKSSDRTVAKKATTEVRVNKGLSSGDRNQFN